MEDFGSFKVIFIFYNPKLIIMEEQNFKNHSRLVPMFHYVTFAFITLIIGGSIIKFYKSYTTSLYGLLTPALFLLIGMTLLLLAWYARVFALKAQDRAIRAEENLRCFVMTGKLLDSKLTMGQIIGLRFASDNEFVELARKAVAENMKQADIKKAIQHWKADHNRV